MKIVCVGGGPSGLCFAILMKLQDPSHDVIVYERNKRNDTFGWGVVFSDRTLENLAEVDPVLSQRIIDRFVHWDDIEVYLRGSVTRTTGHGFVGIGRLQLLQLLAERAEALGVEIEYGSRIDGLERFDDADLIIAADGIHSAIRARYADRFRPNIDRRKNKFIWLGTHRHFDAFTFVFNKTEHGWFTAHAYPFDADTSTFIVECTEETWRAHRGEEMDSDRSIEFCESLFAEALDGERLMSNARHLRGREWLTFQRVDNARWHHKNIVLIGDAAHTAHFSIGSGTKLGFEDAIALSEALQEESLESALRSYESTRRIEVLKLQSAARNSTEWFENIARYERLEPKQFCYSLLTRSQRIGHENLRLRDRAWVEEYERWFAARATKTSDASAVPPMFTPYKLRDLTLKNRVVLSPMAMYSAEDGLVDDFHLVHLGARAMGGAGLILTEMTAVSQEGRITERCAGLYNESHVEAWRRIVRFAHQNSSAKVGMQLGHAGPKGSAHPPWEGEDLALDPGWPLLGPSAISYAPSMATPREMTRADMDAVIAQFVASAAMAQQAEFDWLELHCAHGYLLSAFLTPLSNQRTDAYGGTLENRLRFPLEVARAVRARWPMQKPMSVRISATDWVEGGVDREEAVRISTAFNEAGADIINVSAGQTSKRAEPVYGRMFQTPLSDQIRNEGGVPTMAVGNIYSFDHVNAIIAAGRADLCCLGRPHLWSPSWTLQAAAEQHVSVDGPRQYVSGFEQLQRILERETELIKI